MDVWKDLNEAGLPEPLISDESSLPGPAVSPSMSEEINPAFPEHGLMAYPEKVVVQDTDTHFYNLS